MCCMMLHNSMSASRAFSRYQSKYKNDIFFETNFEIKTSDKILRRFDLASHIRSKVTSYMQSFILFLHLKMISTRSKRRRTLSLVFILKITFI